VSLAYVDTSVLVAIALGEPGADDVARELATFRRIAASPLLDAELRSAMRREGRTLVESIVEQVTWVLPQRELTPEIRRVFDVGYLRGADCLHLASALYIATDPAATTFLTLDSRQRTVAKALGFKA
jgi:predicted nucleic acid-binding protein